VHRNVAVDNSEDNLGTANPARHLLVQGLAKRQAGKSVDNLVFIDLQPHRPPVQVPVRCKVEERGDKAPTVNQVGSLEAERQLLLSKGRGRGSRSAERKRERALHRQGHSNSC
jgi:hypothetical protein